MTTRIKTQRVRITARDRRALESLLAEHPLDILGGGVRQQEDGTVYVEALAPEDRVKRLRKQKVTITVLDKDAGATGRARQKEVGKGDPFGSGVPRGLGRKVRESGHGLS